MFDWGSCGRDEGKKKEKNEEEEEEKKMHGIVSMEIRYFLLLFF